MIDSLLRRPGTIARWRSGPFGPYLDTFASVLVERGLLHASVLDRLQAVNAFGRWLSKHGFSPADVDERLLERYVESSRYQPTRRLPKTAVGLTDFIEVLRQHGVCSPPPERLTPAAVFLREYEEYLRQCRGLADLTRRNYRRPTRLFVEKLFGTGPLDWSALTADDVTAFVHDEAVRRKGRGPQTPASAVRVLLRYLVANGLIRDGLQGAVPKLRVAKLAYLPERLTAEQVRRALDVWDGSADPQGLRNRAILLLLARLGVRAHEVRQLRLDDIDWTGGRLLIRAGKTNRERSLPLPDDVGEAITAYLKAGRPPSAYRHVFLTLRPPYQPFTTSTAVSTLVRSALERTGVKRPRCGAHLLRHTVASQMVCNGATFKDVADVLGHLSIDTTEIYAKLDLENLARVALAWPGGER